MFPTADLHAEIAAVCPITSVSVGKATDRTTWGFVPSPEATPEQISEALNVLQRWVPPPVISKTPEIDEMKRRLDVLTSALSALASEATSGAR